MEKRRKYSFLEAKQKIEAWCSYRERCHSEVATKLFGFGLDAEDTNALIANLIQNNFLNEQRFAESYVFGKINIKKWGRNKIIAALKQKKVSLKCINNALSEIDELQYLSHLEELACKKWKEKKGNDFEKSVKIQHFLTTKGYEIDLIYSAIEKIRKN